MDGEAHLIVIPVTAMIPVRPSEEEKPSLSFPASVTKAEVWEVVRVVGDVVSVSLDGQKPWWLVAGPTHYQKRCVV